MNNNVLVQQRAYMTNRKFINRDKTNSSPQIFSCKQRRKTYLLCRLFHRQQTHNRKIEIYVNIRRRRIGKLNLTRTHSFLLYYLKFMNERYDWRHCASVNVKLFELYRRFNQFLLRHIFLGSIGNILLFIDSYR